MDAVISCDDLAKRMGQGLLVVDVMTPEDYSVCHLPGARNACVYEMVFLEHMAECAPDTAQPVVVYDATGRTQTAGLARERLLAAGYTDVAVLLGGLLAWQRAGLPVEGCAETPWPRPVLADGRYRVDTDKSVLEWIGRNLNYRHYGRLGLGAGELTVAGGELATARLVIDMRAMSNLDLQDPQLRDMLLRHLASEDFFAVERYDSAVMELTGWKRRESLPPEAPGGTAACDLTIKGVTRQVELPLTVAPQLDGTVKVHAACDIDRTLWGVRYGSGKFFERLGMHLVDDLISLELFLTATPA